MRAILLSVGSRGDVEPYLSLSQDLLRRSGSNNNNSNSNNNNKVHPWQVDLWLQSDLQHLASPYLNHSSFHLYTFPFGSADFYSVVKNSDNATGKIKDHPDARMKHVRTMALIIEKLVLPCLPAVLKSILPSQKEHNSTCQDCIIVSSAYTRSMAFILGRLLQVRVVLLHLQPLLPNRILPSYRTSRNQFVQACLDSTLGVFARYDGDDVEETYWRIEQALETYFLKESIEQTYRDLSIPPFSWDEMKTILQGKNNNFWIVNAYSNELIPKLAGSPGIGQNVVEIGPLADQYIPRGAPESLGRDLETFLRKAQIRSDDDTMDLDKPICVGFGSMPFHHIKIVLQAFEELGTKAILVGSSLKIPRDHPAIRNGSILWLPNTPYVQLLPHCSMMLCHGGVGVVQACMRAGIPCLISPLMGDQFALAKLVEAKGYGAQCGENLSTITSKDIVAGVSKGRDCMGSCKLLGVRIRRCEGHLHGAQMLSSLLELLISKS